jgi:hypothetical protein
MSISLCVYACKRDFQDSPIRSGTGSMAKTLVNLSLAAMIAYPNRKHTPPINLYFKPLQPDNEEPFALTQSPTGPQPMTKAVAPSLSGSGSISYPFLTTKQPVGKMSTSD